MTFPINFSQHRKTQQNPSHGVKLKNQYSCFSHSIGASLPLDFHPMECFITWEMHVFPHQFPLAWEKAAKHIEWGKPRKLVPIQFLSIDVFSHQITILWYTSSHGKFMYFPINVPRHEKRQQNLSKGENLRNWFPYNFRSMGVFFLQITILWYTSSHGKCMCFSHQFPIAWEKAAKPIKWRKPEKLVPIQFQWYSCFFHWIPILWYTFSYGKLMGFSHQFSIVQKNARKFT